MSRPRDSDVLLLEAIGDPARLAILRQLALNGPSCACDLTRCCGVGQSTVSHHLKVLREAGWVESERRGSWIWYSLRAGAADQLRSIADSVRHRTETATRPMTQEPARAFPPPGTPPTSTPPTGAPPAASPATPAPGPEPDLDRGWRQW